MNIRTMIETAVDTLSEQDRARMRAAMELGARFALESVIQKSPYSSDAKEVLDELENRPTPPSTPIEPAPVAVAPSAPLPDEALSF